MSRTLDLLNLAKRVSKYCVGMEGNVSAKLENGCLIKASGANLNDLNIDDLVEFDFNGKQVSNMDRKGSMELSFHQHLLCFSSINYVSHTHPTNTLKILCSRDKDLFASKRLFPDQVIFNGKKSCLIPYAKPGTDLTNMIQLKLSHFIETEGCFPKLMLLENHGIITCGKTIEECIISSDICEKSAEIFSGVETDKLIFLTDNEVIALSVDDNERYREQLVK